MNKTIAPNVQAEANVSANVADQAIESTRRAANHALDSLHTGIETLREGVPQTLGRAAAQVESIARRGLDRARETGDRVREQVHHAGDRTVGYIREEPVKAILIAAATGAALAALIGWVASRSRD